MVIIWNQLAHGDVDYSAIPVIINSVLQIILYSPMSLLFVNVISHETALKLEYGQTAIAVLIYLGIPLAAGIITRFGVIAFIGKEPFEMRFLPYFGPLALIGLLYTFVILLIFIDVVIDRRLSRIILIFAEQATRILDNIGEVFRVFVPMICDFVIMWTGAFVLVYWLTPAKEARRSTGTRWRSFRYVLGLPPSWP
jgi:ACR3 family arsenite transporter